MIRSLATAVTLAVITCTALSGEPNTLTEEEKADGWKLLFDGRTTEGWVNIGKTTFPDHGWSVKDGTLSLTSAAKAGDIITTDTFDNFELTWEWKISAAGNSGVKYNLPNPAKAVGFEYQMIDDEKHPDAKAHGPSHQTASLYALIPPSETKMLKPVGEWNESRILMKGNHVEHWLNGGRTVEFEMGGDALKEAIAKSKFKKVAGFGERTKSPILLQDHGDAVDVRSMKIRVLDAK